MNLPQGLKIDEVELLVYASQAAPHIKNSIELERWIESSVAIMNRTILKNKPGMSPEVRSAEIVKKLKYELDKMSKFTMFDLSVIYTSHNGGFIRIGDENYNSRTVVSEKLAHGASDFWNNNDSRYDFLGKKAHQDLMSSLSQYGLTPISNIVASANKGDKVWKDHEWFLPKINGLFKDKKGRVWLTDVQFPKDEEALSRALNDATSSKLQKASVISKYLLDNFNLSVDRFIVGVFDYKEFETRLSSIIKPDMNLAIDMLEVGDYYYDNYVLEERLPVPQFGKSNYTSITEIPDLLKRATLDFTTANKLRSQADKEVDECKNRITEALAISGIEYISDSNKTTVNIGPVNVSMEYKSKLDTGKLLTAIHNLAASKGIEIELDEPQDYEQMLLDKYKSLGGDVSDNELYNKKQSSMFTLVRGKTHASYDVVQQAADLSVEMVNEARKQFLEQNNVSPNKESSKELTEEDILNDFMNELEDAANDKMPSFDSDF